LSVLFCPILSSLAMENVKDGGMKWDGMGIDEYLPALDVNMNVNVTVKGGSPRSCCFY